MLTQFEQAGLLVRHHFESGKAVFELNEGKHHDHLVCLQCGRVEEFYDAEIEKRQTKIARERGFEISEHALYLYAECTQAALPAPQDRRARMTSAELDAVDGVAPSRRLAAVEVGEAKAQQPQARRSRRRAPAAMTTPSRPTFAHSPAASQNASSPAEPPQHGAEHAQRDGDAPEERRPARLRP